MTSRRLTPADCLAALPEPELDLPPGLQDDVRAIDLRHAALIIAELDHAAEIAQVLAAAEVVSGDSYADRPSP